MFRSNDNIIGADPADAMPLSIRLIVYAIVGILESVFSFQIHFLTLSFSPLPLLRINGDYLRNDERFDQSPSTTPPQYIQVRITHFDVSRTRQRLKNNYFYSGALSPSSTLLHWEES